MKILAIHPERRVEGKILSHINVTPPTNADLAVRNTEEIDIPKTKLFSTSLLPYNLQNRTRLFNSIQYVCTIFSYANSITKIPEKPWKTEYQTANLNSVSSH